jgi:hypothetical protein
LAVTYNSSDTISAAFPWPVGGGAERRSGNTNFVCIAITTGKQCTRCVPGIFCKAWNVLKPDIRDTIPVGERGETIAGEKKDRPIPHHVKRNA